MELYFIRYQYALSYDAGAIIYNQYEILELDFKNNLELKQKETGVEYVKHCCNIALRKMFAGNDKERRYPFMNVTDILIVNKL